MSALPQALPATELPTLIAELSSVLPADSLITDSGRLRAYECDGLMLMREMPLAVALPTTEAQVVAVLRTCHRLGVPVVPRGAGTGLSGGATPHRPRRRVVDWRA
jgi:glycolate oxidase